MCPKGGRLGCLLVATLVPPLAMSQAVQQLGSEGPATLCGVFQLSCVISVILGRKQNCNGT